MDHAKTEHGFFFFLLGSLTLGFLVLLSGFFQPIFWAAIIGIVFLPVQHRLEVRFGGRHTLAAVTTLLIILFTVLVPAFLVAGAVADQGLQLYQRLQSGAISPGAILSRVEGMLPDDVQQVLGQLGLSPGALQERLTRAAVDASGFVAGMAVSIGQNISRFAAMFMLMLYLLFFALRDGEELLDRLTWALPLGDERERYLFAKFAEVGRATIKGTMVVGTVQGLLGGIMFAILGIQGAVFWGVVMIFLSILPAVGATLVWLPAGAILIFGGDWVRGLILLGFGALVISLVDNILRPLLVGRDTKMPDWLILLSTLGGLTMFGISGFAIGPILAALFLTVWTMLGEEQERQRSGAAGSHPDEASTDPD
ncbi:MAG: AI-2E family transporter, partial [Gemmatimonadota bacterium]